MHSAAVKSKAPAVIMHVEAGEQGCGIDPPVVADEPFTDDHRAAEEGNGVG